MDHVALRDSTRMGDWDEVGKANWGTKDGAVAADWLEAEESLMRPKAMALLFRRWGF